MDLTSPRLMSILNLTPDSFYDGGRNNQLTEVLRRIENEIELGAYIFDLGAWSSRPGAVEVPMEEEWRRLEPFLTVIRSHFPEIFISVDTYRAEIVSRVAAEGADLINDISGGTMDGGMLEAVGKSGLPYVLMHMRGTPATMNSLTVYEDIVIDLCAWFADRLVMAREAGIRDIILDPGLGFAKKMEQSYELLGRLDEFRIFELPVLTGLSRKSMVSKLLGVTTAEALNGSTAAHMIALENGASILRVHDIKDAAQALKIWRACRQFSEKKSELSLPL